MGRRRTFHEIRTLGPVRGPGHCPFRLRIRCKPPPTPCRGQYAIVSFYAYDRICDALELTQDEYLVVRNSLIDKDLIAFDGRRFQVLSLPPAPILPARRPLVTQEDFEDHDPATIQHIIRSSLDRRR